MTIKKFNDKTTFLKESLVFFEKSIKPEPTYVALSGGLTPKPFYESLAQSELDLKQVSFYLVDERYIPTDHFESNFNLIYETLIKHKDVRSFSFFNTSLDIADALKAYDKKLKLIPKQVFDLVILGIGADGHIASLFPQTIEKIPENQLTAHTQTDIFNIKNRLTLTPKLILKAQKILILLKGEEKKEIIDELISGKKEPKDFPAKILKRHPDVTIHYLEN